MSNKVAYSASGVGPAPYGLYSQDGGRKYVNRTERLRVLAVLRSLKTDQALFVLVLTWAGARISEVLALSAASFQIEDGLVSIVTLKRRRFCVREVPLPPALIRALDRCFRLRALQSDPIAAQRRLWRWHRVTAWRLVKKVMGKANVTGRPSTPRGLRHGFGVGALRAGVPLNLLQRWLGHAQISTTAIYAEACGPEERAFAARFWRSA